MVNCVYLVRNTKKLTKLTPSLVGFFLDVRERWARDSGLIGLIGAAWKEWGRRSLSCPLTTTTTFVRVVSEIHRPGGHFSSSTDVIYVVQ